MIGTIVAYTCLCIPFEQHQWAALLSTSNKSLAKSTRSYECQIQWRAKFSRPGRISDPLSRSKRVHDTNANITKRKRKQLYLCKRADDSNIFNEYEQVFQASPLYVDSTTFVIGHSLGLGGNLLVGGGALVLGNSMRFSELPNSSAKYPIYII
jgi:hypothetical protein